MGIFETDDSILGGSFTEGAFGHSPPATHEAAGSGPATASGTGGSTTSHASTSRTAGPLKDVYDPPRPSGQDVDQSVQQKVNREIAQSFDGDAAGIVATAALALPPPVPSAAFPAISHEVRRDPGSYARAFVRELLDLGFAKQSRAALLEWVVSETSPAVYPGVPASVAPKVLFSTIVGHHSPIPTAAAWAVDAKDGVTWSVSDLSTITNSDWTRLVSTGWEPPDLRMDVLDVSRNLTIRSPGHAPVVKPFSIGVVVGTAEYHHGYGAMAIGDWRLGR